MHFLTAEWNNLLFANYSVPSDVLEPYIPPGTRIDRYDGHVFISLVAFMFNKTRIMGIPIPYHINFEEVNLRFYVTPSYDKTIRGVTFIKEIVPRISIPLVANNLFNENYIKMKMSHKSTAENHFYSFGEGDKFKISGEVTEELQYPSVGSVNEFITEHYWGYSKGKQCTLEYEVQHPQWKCCKLSKYQIDIDYGSVYGEEFEFLNELEPFNVMYARGSAVSVSFPRRV